MILSINSPPVLLATMRAKMRLARMSLFTEKHYSRWVKYFIHFHKPTHPRDMGAVEIVQFLTYLAVQKKVSA